MPLLAAAVLVFLHAALSRWLSDLLAVLTAGACAVMCLLLLVHVGGGLEVYWFGGWHPRGGLAIGIDFAVDATGAGLATFVSVLMVLALVLSARHIDVEHPYYHVLMLVFMAGMVGFCLSGDLFNMFVMFELMSVAAVALVGYKVRERAALEGGLNFAVINTIGAFLFLLGIGLIYSRTGALNLAQIAGYLRHSGNDRVVVAAFTLIAAALLIKAAVVPFHYWLADAYAVALTPVCLLLAGAFSEMGIYGLGRVLFSAFSPALGGSAGVLRAILVTVGVLTALWGAAMALCEDHLKRLLAFVTISFVGVFLCGIGLLRADGVAGTAVYVVADGFGKALLFACVGIVQLRHGRLGQRNLHGRARDLRLTGGLFLLGALSLSSLPPFGAFLGKSMIDDAALKAGLPFLPPLIVLASALCSGAVLRAGARVFCGWGEVSGGADEADDDTEPESGAPHERVPVRIYVVTVLLAAGALGSGVWFGLADLATVAAHRLIDAGAYRTIVYGGPVALVPGSSPAPESTDWLLAAASTLGAVAVAAAGLWGRRASRAPTRLLDGLGRVMAPVRASHTGRVGDYVAALALGLGLLAASMTLTLR